MTQKVFNAVSEITKKNPQRYTAAFLQNGNAIINIRSILIENETLIIDYMTASIVDGKRIFSKNVQRVHRRYIQKLI